MIKNGINQHAKTGAERKNEILTALGEGEMTQSQIAEAIGTSYCNAGLYLRDMSGVELSRRVERKGRVATIFYSVAKPGECDAESDKTGAKVIIRAAKSREADTPKQFDVLAHLFGRMA